MVVSDTVSLLQNAGGAKAVAFSEGPTAAKIDAMKTLNFAPFQRFLVPLGALVLIVLAYRSYGWAGVAAALGALVMWALLHFTRMLQLMQRAAQRPKGFVDSAVMLNAKLHVGMTLLQVLALTRALGESITSQGEQPEVFCWRDASGSTVGCEFHAGRLKSWTLVRPPGCEADAAP